VTGAEPQELAKPVGSGRGDRTGPARRGYEGGSYAPGRPSEPLFDWGDVVWVVSTRLRARRYARMPASKIPRARSFSFPGAAANVMPVMGWVGRLDRFVQPMGTSTRVDAETCGPGPL
jgi:hypothetical protein